MSFPKRNDDRWMALYDITKRYVEKHLTTPSALHEFEGEKIGQWYRNQTRLFEEGTILPQRKQLLEQLRDFVHISGIEQFKLYTNKTGLFPLEKTIVGEYRLGKWYQNLLSDYQHEKVSEDTVRQLNEISTEWFKEQTVIVGTEWYDQVPFGELPITIVLTDKESIKFFKEGIYGCNQLFDYCEQVIGDIDGKNREKWILRYRQAKDLKTYILEAMFPERIPQYNMLLWAIFGRNKAMDQITECMCLIGNAETIAKKRKSTVTTESPSFDDFANAIGNIFTENRLNGFVDDEIDEDDLEETDCVIDDDDDLDLDFLDIDDIFEDELKVTLNELVTNKAKYIGKEVEISHELITGALGNYPMRKSFYCYRIKESSNCNEADTSNILEVFYDKLPNAKTIVLLKLQSEVITVKGKVIKYSNSDDVYLDATEIGGLEKPIKAMEATEPVPVRYPNSWVHFRQLIAFPKECINRSFQLRHQFFTLIENDTSKKVCKICESTGDAIDAYNKNNYAYYAYDENCVLNSTIAEKQKIRFFGYLRLKDGCEEITLEGGHLGIVHDFSIETASIKMILAFPQKYIGKKVELVELMAVSSNNVKRKSFKTIQSVGEGRNDLVFSNSIEVFYRNVININQCVMIDADYQKIKIIGTVCKYSDSDDVFIEATKITGDCLK